jgi:outer membrane receptor protein involved in Fe transport
VDVTLIPLSAVDRIEIVTGGAAAVYGSDAVAGVVNIILRDDYQGLEMSSALGGATESGGFLQHYSLLGGRAWDSGNAFADVDCAWQQQIDSSQRSFVPADIAGTTLLPKNRYCSTVVSATRDLAGKAAGSLTGIYTTRANSASDYLGMPSQGELASTRARVAQYAAIATVRVPLGADWIAAFASSSSADDFSGLEHLPPLPQYGILDEIVEGNKIDNRLWSVEINLDGTLLQLPTGAMKLAAGAGYNQEDFAATQSNSAAQSHSADQFSIAAQRRVRFLYTEALTPLLSPRDNMGTSNVPSALMLRVAGRAAWYSDVGSTINPKIGLLYRPTPDFGIEVSWGTSYRAPTLLQQYNSSQVTLECIQNPTQNLTQNPCVTSGTSPALLEFGGNPRLRPEQSSDLTLDFALTPHNLPDTALKITLFDINDRKRIDYPTPNTTNPLSDPNVWPFVTYKPLPSTIAQVLQQSQLVNALNLPVADATLLIDDLNQNITRQRASGVDLVAAQGGDTSLGRFDGFLSLAYLNLRQQVTPASPIVPLSGTIFYPPTWRSRLALNWKEGGYRGAVFVNYVGPSRNTTTPAQDPIASWTSLDASMGYILAGSGHRANTRLTLSAQNVLDHRPPFASIHLSGAPNINFDSTNGSAIGRFVTLQVTLER